MNNLIISIITLLSAFLVIYHHLGYPLILHFLAKKKPINTNHVGARHYTETLKDKQLASIFIIIPAYNEAQWISEKIRNLAALDYPSNRLKIIIGCDGCTDNTFTLANEVAKEPECAHLNINIINFKQNRGKVAVLNSLLAQQNSDLIALTDTSALLSIDALLIAS